MVSPDFNDGGSVVLELDSAMELSKEFVRGSSLGGGIGGLLYTRGSSGSMGCFHYDGQGNVVSVTHESREEVAYYEYDAWGNLLTECGGLSNHFKFSTKQASTGTGLVDFGYRWYDPTAGRWTQRDPIGHAGSLNLYGYCHGSPSNAMDTDGSIIEVYDYGGALIYEWDARKGGDPVVKDKKKWQASQARKDLARIRNTWRGWLVIICLAGSDDTVKIKPFDAAQVPEAELDDRTHISFDSKPDAVVEQAGGTGKGSGSEINYPTGAQRMKDEDGMLIPPDVHLLHELYHAMEAANGCIDPRVQERFGFPTYEVHAACYENLYRAERGGIGQRRHYKYGDTVYPVPTYEETVH